MSEREQVRGQRVLACYVRHMFVVGASDAAVKGDKQLAEAFLGLCSSASTDHAAVSYLQHAQCSFCVLSRSSSQPRPFNLLLPMLCCVPFMQLG